LPKIEGLMNTLLFLIALVGQDPAVQMPAPQTSPQKAIPAPGVPLPAPRQVEVDGKAPAPDNGIAVQTTGPIHEAFAQPIDKNPTPTVTVPKAPPPPVPELPPSEKPEGTNVQWIPGYWGWDPEKKDYLWISGVWRNMPPNRKWEPGYWNKVADGWQWTQGFWGDAKQVAKPQYLPQPPNSLDEGPSQPSPNENYFYIPGAWVFRDGQYVWRPGFWYPAQENWVYVPPYYSYTPAGSVYVDGYWDYPLADRGTLYAPVTFSQPYWNDPGWYYQPSYALGFGIGGPWNCLFVGSGFGHYYCGNYFSPFWGGVGFRPWYAWGARNFDPLFAYNHWHNRYNPGWYNGLHNNYWARVNNPALRPPNTLAQAHAMGARGGAAGGFVPRAIAGQNAAGRGNFSVASATTARNFQQGSRARAQAERAATPAGGISSRSAATLSTRPAGGFSSIASTSAIRGGSSSIASTSAIRGGSARIANGPASANLSRGAVASTSGISQATFHGTTRSANPASASSNLGSRSTNRQSFYGASASAAPTPLYQARPGQGLGASAFNNANAMRQVPGGTGALNNASAMRNVQGVYNGRSYGGPAGGYGNAGLSARSYSPSISNYSGRPYGGSAGANLGARSYAAPMPSYSGRSYGAGSMSGMRMSGSMGGAYGGAHMGGAASSGAHYGGGAHVGGGGHGGGGGGGHGGGGHGGGGHH
jgi:hypothetical protein